MLTYNKNLILYIKESDVFYKRPSFDQTDAELVLAQAASCMRCVNDYLQTNKNSLNKTPFHTFFRGTCNEIKHMRHVNN